MQRLGEDVGGCGRVPLGTLAADRCGPHQIQNGREVDHYVNGGDDTPRCR